MTGDMRRGDSMPTDAKDTVREGYCPKCAKQTFWKPDTHECEWENGCEEFAAFVQIARDQMQERSA